MTMEIMALREPRAASPAVVIDSAVVLSVRRDLIPDRLYCRNKAGLSTMDHKRESVPYHFVLWETRLTVGIGRIQPQCLQFSAHPSKSSCTNVTILRSMEQKRSPPKRAIMSLARLSHVKHASVSRPRSGGTERGTSDASSMSSCPLRSRFGVGSWSLRS